MSLQIQLKKSAVSQKQPFASDLAVGELALNYNADGPFLTCKDTAGNVRKLNNVWVAATAPTSPSAGDLWLDTSSATPVLKAYKDSITTWVGATSVPLATTTVFGTVRLASAADVTNGTSGKVVDAAQLQSKVAAEISSALNASPTTIQDLTVSNNATITGNLTVNGTTTTIDTTNLLVEDKNIEMGVVATPTNTTADGGGITLRGATNKTINWVNATGAWTSSERFSYPLGTAAAPTITFTGDPNTGIYSPGADQLALSTNGTGRLFVDSSGRVGVGTAAPAVPLSVATAASGEALRLTNGTNNERLHFYTGANALVEANNSNLALTARDANSVILSTTNTERLRITSAGLVGIGTSAPGTTLHVAGTGLIRTSAGASPAPLPTQTSSFSVLEQTAYNASPSTSINIGSSNNDSSNFNTGFQWRITTPSTASAGATLTFNSYSFDGTSTYTTTPRMVITSAGLVGVGTSDPKALLDVTGGPVLTKNIPYAGNQNAAYLIAGTTSYTGATTNPGTYGLQHRFKIDGSGTSRITVDGHSGEFFCINDQGRVGIGTTSPNYSLHVNGSCAVAGDKNFRLGEGSFTYYYDLGRDASTGKFVIDGNQTGSVSYSFRKGGTSLVDIDNSGRLLVGTSSGFSVPAYQGSWTTLYQGHLQLAGVSTASTTAAVTHWGSTNDSGASISLAKSRSNAVGTYGGTALADNSTLGTIVFSGDDGSKFVTGAVIRAAVDGTPGSNNMPGRLVFSTTADGASSPTERMRITQAGSLFYGTGGVIIDPSSGTTDGLLFEKPSNQLVISRDGGGSLILRRRSSDGTIQGFYRDTTLVGTISVTTTATAYNTSSDYRLKENVTAVIDGITRLQQLKPSRFNFIADPTKTVDGFIAHEVQSVVPEAITGEKDAVDDEGNPEYQGIDQSKLVPLLTAALQEAIAKIESLEARLTAAGI